MNSTNHTTNLVFVLLLETLVNLVNWQISSGGAAFFFFSTFTTFLVKFRTLTLPVQYANCEEDSAMGRTIIIIMLGFSGLPRSSVIKGW